MRIFTYGVKLTSTISSTVLAALLSSGSDTFIASISITLPAANTKTFSSAKDISIKWLAYSNLTPGRKTKKEKTQIKRERESKIKKRKEERGKRGRQMEGGRFNKSITMPSVCNRTAKRDHVTAHHAREKRRGDKQSTA